MSSNPAWRGERRVRVALEFRPRSVRVAGLRAIAGPAVQRPAMDGTHVALVSVDGAVVVLQSFDDPRLVRASQRPGVPGHHFSQVERAVVHIDVPLSAGAPNAILIRAFDLSGLARRPVEPAALQVLLQAQPTGARQVALVTMADLAAHPEAAAAGVPLANSTAAAFEIYIDRAKRYRWRLRRPDGQIVADSAQGYSLRADCESDLRWVRQSAGSVPVISNDLT